MDPDLSGFALLIISFRASLRFLTGFTNVLSQGQENPFYLCLIIPIKDIQNLGFISLSVKCPVYEEDS